MGMTMQGVSHDNATSVFAAAMLSNHMDTYVKYCPCCSLYGTLVTFSQVSHAFQSAEGKHRQLTIPGNPAANCQPHHVGYAQAPSRAEALQQTALSQLHCADCNWLHQNETSHACTEAQAITIRNDIEASCVLTCSFQKPSKARQGIPRQPQSGREPCQPRVPRPEAQGQNRSADGARSGRHSICCCCSRRAQD